MKKSFIIVMIFGVLTTLMFLESCQKEGKLASKGNQQPSLFPETASEYAVLIEPELGVVPTVLLDSMVEIPLYQNGNQVYGVFQTSSELDNPTRFGKATVSGSAIQRYEGVSANGAPMPDVTWIAFLRNSSENASDINGSVQLIGYNQVSGATAFFESGVINNQNNVTHYASAMNPVTFKITGQMPGPDNPSEFNTAYTPPPGLQCVSCHQADPFITNTFITAAKIPGTNEPVVPLLGADAPYYVIGGENWDMRTIKIEGNACLSCHRVGLATAELFAENDYHVNSYMPPNNPGSLSEDYLELMNAWINGPENTPNAEWIIPPGNGQPEQIVGEDYPYQAEFNEY